MKIATIARLTYTPGELEYFQFIRGGVGTDNHQEPEFHQYPDGDVLMYWNAYDFDECSNNCVKLYSVSHDRGETWSEPEIFMADFLGGVPYFVKMLALRGTREVLMLVEHVFRHAPGAGITVDKSRRVATAHADYFKQRSRIVIQRSADGGRTFDHGLVWDGVTGLNELRQLQSGRVVAAFCFMDPECSDAEKKIQHYTLVALFSDDGGRTWTRSNEITVESPRGAMECQIAETEPDRLLCLFRTKAGYVHQSVSEDGGRTWGPAEPTTLPSPESMVRMLRLQSGNLLVVWNNVSSTTQQPRHPLSAVLSKDGGRTWGALKVIADEIGGNQLSNHGLIQLDDGRILLGINHYRDVRPMTSDLDIAIFDENWLANSNGRS